MLLFPEAGEMCSMKGSTFTSSLVIVPSTLCLLSATRTEIGGIFTLGLHLNVLFLSLFIFKV